MNIKKAELEDINEFLLLLNSEYNRKKTFDYARWQYFNNDSQLLLLQDNNKIVGSYGLKFLPIIKGNILLNSVLITDIILHKDYRGKGYLKLLEQEATRIALNKNVNIMTVFPNKYGKLAQEKLGWTTIGGWNTEEPTEESVCNLYNNKNIFYTKSADYFEYRYFNNPVYNYNVFYLNNENYLIYKIYNNTGDIVDSHITSTNINEIKYLYLSCTKMLKDSGLNSVIMASPTNIPKDRYFCIKLLSDTEDNNICNIDKWKFNLGDAEVY